MLKMTLRKPLSFLTMVLGVCLIPATAFAQRARGVPSLDLAVTYTADRSNPVNGANQWMQGGGFELGASIWHGLGVAAKLTGVTTQGLGTQNTPLSLIVITFGPRYRFTRGRWSVYGETLIGQANGFNSLFAGDAETASSSSANALALELGGGLDWRCARHFGVRAVQSSWVRSDLPNATTNVQNQWTLGSGLVLRF